jgi:hypothetical protein
MASRIFAVFSPGIRAAGLYCAAFALAGLWPAMAFAETIPLPRPRPVQHQGPPGEPRSFAEANPGLFNPAELSAEPSACRLRLEALAVAEPLPRLIGPGTCGGVDMVRLKAVTLADKNRVAIMPPAQIRCEMAEAIANWVRDDLAARFPQSRLVSIENYDSYECRGRNRVINAKISEHGKGNALDVRAFILANGRRVSPVDVHADHALREGLRDGACARFSTVLGPGSDGFHEEHIHVDIAERRSNFRLCRWQVRDPELASVPLPRPRPANLGEPVPEQERSDETGNDKNKL